MSSALPTTGPAAVGLILRFDDAVPVLVLPENHDFDGLRTCLREQLPALAAEIGGRSIRFDLGARDIALFDLRRVLNLLRQEFSIDVTGLYARSGAIHRFAERELKLKLFPVDALVPDPAVEDATPTADPEPAPAPSPLDKVTLPNDLRPADLAAVPGPVNQPSQTPVQAPAREDARRSHSVHRTLRSGASVRYDGDLYVFGDVNPGAQVVATGNIVVLGALKGVAHAGAAGDEDAFILAFDLRPTQLRIGRRIAVPPARRPDGEFSPERASVVDGQIVLEPYGAGRR